MTVFNRAIAYVFEWIKQQLNCSDKSDEAWEPYLQEGDNSLSIFQNSCNKKLQNALFHLDEIKSAQRVEKDDNEKYIIGVIPKSKIEYRIYRDAAQIGTFYYLDRQAYKTPELLIESFVKMVKESTQTGEEYQ